jgi:phage/plasmid-associated DNA primase
MELFEYLLNYVAHMLQRPEEKPGVMVVLLGSQGTGKGLFFQILQRIWGRTSLLVSDIQQVVGNFNAALERNYVIMMDEALFSGDRKSQNRMKSFITEKSCTVEQKYQPSRTINSVHRFFASSNHEHFSHVEADDRRLLIVKVSKSRQGDRAYFSDLAAAIDDDTVIAAMVHNLMQLNLNQFDVRQRPLTQEHASQKIQSLQGFDRYWFEVLTNGRFGLEAQVTFGTNERWTDGGFISTKSLCERYQYYDKQSQRFGPTLTKTIGGSIEKLCPSAEKDRKTEPSGQSRGYKVPPLEVARGEMAAYLKCTIDWGDGEVVELTDE